MACLIRACTLSAIFGTSRRSGSPLARAAMMSCSSCAFFSFDSNSVGATARAG